MDSADSLERLTPDQIHIEDRAGRESLELHRARYEFAAIQAERGPLLDLACGVGYGTRLLGDRRSEFRDLTGVDISQYAIEYAQAHYACERVRYVQEDAMTFGAVGPMQGSFNTIVSLETIEHLPEPDRFFVRLFGLLAPGGVLIASVPVTPSVDLNPHHSHDFTARGFREMGARIGLNEIASHRQVQRISPSELWSGDRRFRRENLRPNLVAYYATHPVGLLKRVATVLRHGFANHYLTIAWKKDR